MQICSTVSTFYLKRNDQQYTSFTLSMKSNRKVSLRLPYVEKHVKAILKLLDRCPRQIDSHNELPVAVSVINRIAKYSLGDIREAERRIVFMKLPGRTYSFVSRKAARIGLAEINTLTNLRLPQLYALNRYIFDVPHWVPEHQVDGFLNQWGIPDGLIVPSRTEQQKHRDISGYPYQSPTTSRNKYVEFDERYPWKLLSDGRLKPVKMWFYDRTDGIGGWVHPYYPSVEFDYFLKKYGVRKNTVIAGGLQVEPLPSSGLNRRQYYRQLPLQGIRRGASGIGHDGQSAAVRRAGRVLS